MDLRARPDIAEFRTEVHEFLRSNLPAGWRGIGALDAEERKRFARTWREKLVEAGLIAPAWPREFGGRGLDVVAQALVGEEFVRSGVPHYPAECDGNGFILLAPTMLHWGTEEQKRRFLPATLSGEIKWAQGYSESEAGSDLFGLRTRAELHDGNWVINGHKMWQTAGVHANWIFVLARTDPTARKSKALSLILVPLDQEGVEVRGIKNMAGETEFAEVFFTDAVAPAGNVLGAVGDGARVALTLLGFERGAGGLAAALSYQVELDRLAGLIGDHDLRRDPVVRQRFGECRTTVHLLRCLAMKALSAGASGRPPGAESSVFKLVTAEYRQTVTELARDVLGDDILAPSGAPAVATLGPQPRGLDPSSPAAWTADLLHARPVTVYGGSSQIQRTTIAERVLGLPRDGGDRAETGRN
ncbi:acyl-CoA dehydrogenase [Amycolatopsis acidicola]|uniref:Acyl-CoA dehydrogenase n=1 Tax=Amycolatopsis acidicola TaxID=2596893 RepID=A0A5N0VI74_9PSEU|nr:acyl-CoA dehydrogenase family protein [Amycolatopsis acidicola]KAA9164372.1 acyl-CoA dehydrogenase [Amycolatopsis acidicola]